MQLRPLMLLGMALVLWASDALAANRLVAVLPLDLSHTQGKVNASAQAQLEEMLRDVAVDELGGQGFTVLTGETTLQVLRDNGVDPSKCGNEECHLSSARELKAEFFISGSVQYDEGEFTTSIRLIETGTGRIVASERMEGSSPKALRKTFEGKAHTFFQKSGLVAAPPRTSVVNEAPATVPPPPAPRAPFVTAGIDWHNGKAYLFLSDGRYARYDISADRTDVGYPTAVTNENWPGLAPYAKEIIAACYGKHGQVFFFLKGGRYLRFDTKTNRVDPPAPRPVSDETWPGLGNDASKLIGAVNWSNSKIYFFFSDGRYSRFDVSSNRVDAGYPQTVDAKTWPGVAPYAAKLSGMIEWTNGKAYLFLNDGRYLRYDVGKDVVDDGYPAAVDESNWPGLR